MFICKSTFQDKERRKNENQKVFKNYHVMVELIKV